MSATLIVGYWVDWMQAGVGRFFGRADAAAQHSSGLEAALTTTGGVPGLERSVSVAAAAEGILWDYADDPIDIQYLVLFPNAVGYYTVYVDKPTSSTDYTPLGTHVHRYIVGAACMPTMAASLLSLTALTATDPTQTGTALSSLVAGRVYKIGYYNPGSSAAIVDMKSAT